MSRNQAFLILLMNIKAIGMPRKKTGRKTICSEEVQVAVQIFVQFVLFCAKIHLPMLDFCQ